MAGLLQLLAEALLTDDRCGTATDAINQCARAISIRPSEPEAERNKNADGRRVHSRATR